MDGIVRLTAIEDIRALKARYFRLLDDKRWDDFGALFTADAVMDLSDVLPPGTPPAMLTVDGREAIVAQNRRLLSDAVMVHNGYSHEITVHDAGTASAIWAQEDRVVFPDHVPCPFPHRSSHNFGRYHEDFVRETDGWKIRRLKLVRTFSSAS
ncbi:nuclear transport factor 2 family protein [Novosphingobium sp. BL-52-GroH]|uniref:nuclear transport factor 2 family protein n=1 Tax=Novosphingobium sp. BL-52-GroH TaxID=3349877 RepID=UPI00384E1A08